MKVFLIDPNNNTPQYVYPILDRITSKKVKIYLFTTFNNYGTKYYDEYYKLKINYSFFKFENKIANQSIRRILKVITYPFYLLKLFIKIVYSNPTILHFNWISIPLYDLLLICVCKIMGIKVILTQHNYLQHGKHKLRKFEKPILKLADKIIVLSEYTFNQFPETLHPKISIIDHGNIFEDFAIRNYKKNQSKLTFTFLGGIKEYKGIQTLLDSVKIINEQKFTNIHFVIKGHSNKILDQLIKAFITENSLDDIIQYKSEYISNEEMFKIVSESDVGLLPYNSASQSGLPYLYYKYHKPIIVTNVGALPSQGNDKIRIICEPNSIELAETIIYCRKLLKDGYFRNHEFDEYLSTVSLDNIADEIITVYNKTKV